MEFEVFKRKGGSWLGASRNWIIWNCIHGDSIIWSENPKLVTTHGELTVKDVEEVSAKVGYAVHEKVVDKLKNRREQYQAAVAETGSCLSAGERAILAEKLQLLQNLIEEIEADP